MATGQCCCLERNFRYAAIQARQPIETPASDGSEALRVPALDDTGINRGKVYLAEPLEVGRIGTELGAGCIN